jgi:hypothetical protein
VEAGEQLSVDVSDVWVGLGLQQMLSQEHTSHVPACFFLYVQATPSSTTRSSWRQVQAQSSVPGPELVVASMAAHKTHCLGQWVVLLLSVAVAVVGMWVVLMEVLQVAAACLGALAP